MAAPLYTVLIVNFNGRRHLGPCLGALASQSLPRHRFEVVLVDNASADGSAEFVRDGFPWVRVLRLATKAFGGSGGPHRAGTNACLADGSARFVRESVGLRVLAQLATRAGGEVIDADW